MDRPRVYSVRRAIYNKIRRGLVRLGIKVFIEDVSPPGLPYLRIEDKKEESK